MVGNQVVFNPGTDFDHLALGASEHVTLSYQMQDEHGALSSSTVRVTITGTVVGAGDGHEHGAAGERTVLVLHLVAQRDLLGRAQRQMVEVGARVEHNLVGHHAGRALVGRRTAVLSVNT